MNLPRTSRRFGRRVAPPTMSHNSACPGEPSTVRAVTDPKYEVTAPPSNRAHPMRRVLGKERSDV